ncbi:MAG TPA: cysteine desulfurase [Nitrososphaerales archaeon]|nr:cysteine desulfurase [Nitrososphaerales archaeon]
MQKSGLKSEFLDVEKIRPDFPILKRRVRGKRLVYLDNAATTQKPKQVIDSISEYYTNYNSNIHRSVHTLAEEATEAFEDSRSKVSHFLNAGSTEEIIFTKNATEALNLAANSIVSLKVKEGDKIVVTEMEHHSNFVMWQQLAKKYHARFEIVNVDDEGSIDLADLENKIKNAKIFAFTQMSNVFGTIVDVRRLARIAHDNNCLAVVDGAQSAPHLKVDLQSLDCDFFAISAHKMLGPTGVGCLFGKKKLLEEMPPFLLGGDMIHQVHREDSEWNELPWKFEAGTSNIADVIAFGVAIDYLSVLGMENVAKHEAELSKMIIEELGKIKGLRIYGSPEPSKRGAVFSFNIAKFHPHDIASILDDQGIAIRSGHHCAQIVMEKLNVPATSRASFYLYNSFDDVEALCDGLERVKEVLG